MIFHEQVLDCDFCFFFCFFFWCAVDGYINDKKCFPWLFLVILLIVYFMFLLFFADYILVCTCICLLYITKVTAGAPTPRMSSTKWYMQPFGNGSDEQKGYTEHSEYSKRNTLNELILQCALQISENRPEVFVSINHTFCM